MCTNINNMQDEPNTLHTISNFKNGFQCYPNFQVRLPCCSCMILCQLNTFCIHTFFNKIIQPFTGKSPVWPNTNVKTAKTVKVPQKRRNFLSNFSFVAAAAVVHIKNIKLESSSGRMVVFGLSSFWFR